MRIVFLGTPAVAVPSLRALVDAGGSFEEVVAADPTRGYPARGIPTESWLRLVYDSLREGR